MSDASSSKFKHLPVKINFKTVVWLTACPIYNLSGKRKLITEARLSLVQYMLPLCQTHKIVYSSQPKDSIICHFTSNYLEIAISGQHVQSSSWNGHFCRFSSYPVEEKEILVFHSAINTQ